jgi:hypothetical protein
MSVAVADFNGDGFPDLAIANSGGNNVTVLLGNGSGGFTAASGSPFSAGNSPQSVAVGDFNNDGHPDLAVADHMANQVTVLLGNGSGGFTTDTSSPFAVGGGPVSVAVGDFNGDGNADLAVANYGGGVTVLLGNGSGGFTAASGSPFSAGSGPQSVAVADFNGDGFPDLAVADTNGNNVTVLLGNGSGGFTAASGSPFSTGNSPQSVAVGDFNGDGYPDIATANAGDNNVTVLLGDGSGGFTAATGSPFSAGNTPESLAVGDFNGVGLPGLAIANGGDNDVTLLLNSAPDITANPRSLTFYASTGQAASASIPISIASTQSGSTYTVLANQTWLQASPVSNPTGSTANVTLSAASSSLSAGTYSGIVRFIAPSFFDATTSVTLNVTNPSGTLSPDSSSPFAVGNSPYAVALADFNGDGHQDLAITDSQSSGGVTVLLGNGLGGFTAASGSPFATGAYPGGVAAADFNGDGHPDLAIANNLGNVTVLLGNGSGSFTAAPGSPFAAASGATSVAVADFNGDGYPDLAVANSGASNVTVLLGNGFGEFYPASSPFAAGSIPVWVAVADFNGDGHPDIAVADAGSNQVTVLLGNGLGGFTTAGSFTTGSGPSFVAAADFNGDGHPDLAVVNDEDDTVTVLLGNGSGGFTQPTGSPVRVGEIPFGAAVGDINGDGYPDLAVANQGGNVTILLGNGLGGFTAAASAFTAGSAPVTIAAGDFNQDGLPDLAVVNSGDNTVTVLLGASASTSSTLSTTAGSTIAYGTSVPLNLTVSDSGPAFTSPTGTATFYDGATSLGSASQSASPYTLSMSTFSVGRHSLSAQYSGDSRSLASTSNTLPLTVTQASQTITFGALVNQTFGAVPFTIMATASSGLPVTLTATTLSVCTYSAPLVTIAGAGTCSITASQAGNTDYSEATNVIRSFTVSQASQTITFGPLNNATMGVAPFTISASASSGLPVTFASTTLSVCTVSGTTVTVIAVGTCSITANQPGDTNYSAATGVARSFIIAAEAQTITFNALANVVFGAAPFTISASASSGLPVTFASTTPTVCTVSGATVTILAGGTCSITASQAGNATYGAASGVTRSFAVAAEAQTITFSALANVVFGAAPFTISASATSGLPVSFTSSTPGVCTVSGSTVAIVSPGTCSITASQPGNANYSAAANVTQGLTVGAAPQTIYFSVPFPASYPLSAGSFTVTATASSGLPVTFTSLFPSVCTVSGATCHHSLYG